MWASYEYQAKFMYIYINCSPAVAEVDESQSKDFAYVHGLVLAVRELISGLVLECR